MLDWQAHMSSCLPPPLVPRHAPWQQPQLPLSRREKQQPLQAVEHRLGEEHPSLRLEVHLIEQQLLPSQRMN